MRPGSLYACITRKAAALHWRADFVLLHRSIRTDEQSYRGAHMVLPQTACEDLLQHDKEQPAAYVFRTCWMLEAQGQSVSGARLKGANAHRDCSWQVEVGDVISTPRLLLHLRSPRSQGFRCFSAPRMMQ